MTQTFTSSSPSIDNGEPEKQSTSEIRADIDQTRASVGDKIDQLQARLDPNRLKQQAQETVQEMLNDTASSMTEYVKVHKDEMVTSLADAARRNPLPTALVGLGIGWLILESFAGNRPREEQRWQPDRRYQGASGRAPMPQPYPGFSEGYDERSYEESYGSSDWSRSEYPNGGYSRSQSQPRQGYRQEFDQQYGQASRQEYDRQQYGNGHQQGENPLSKAGNAVKDSVSDMTGRVSDTAGDVKDSVTGTMGNVKNSVSDTIDSVKDSVGGTVEDVKNRVSGAVDDVSERFNDSMGGMRRQAQDMGQQAQRSYERAGRQIDQWQSRARYEGQRRGRQVVGNLEDNPLIYGAVAMAAGAALALLLPQSRAENRAFGDMRDQVMAKGQEVFESAKGHAQQVVEEIRPELEDKARQIVSDVTETGKQAVKDAAAELSPIVDKAVAKSKDEARSVVQEAGIDPDKLTTGKPSGSASSAQSSGQFAGQSSTSPSSKGQPSSSSASSSSSSMSSPSSTSSAASSMGSAGSQSTMPVLNRDTLAGQWKQVKGEVKKKWGQLTDDDMMQIEGNYDKLAGSLQTRYGYTRERVDREINDFFNSQKA
jgi:uncharacterized protein YjbJ (UPF0337 family)